MRATVAEWAANVERKVTHKDGALPLPRTLYDTPCLVGACKCSPGFATATALQDRLGKVIRPKVMDGFLLYIEGTALVRACVVAYLQDRPRARVLLPLEPVLPTVASKLVQCSDLPWRLEFARRRIPGEPERLDFKMDIYLLLELARALPEHGDKEVHARCLHYRSVSLSASEVYAVGAKLELLSHALQEMRNIAADSDSGEDDGWRHDMRAVADEDERRRGAGRGRREGRRRRLPGRGATKPEPEKPASDMEKSSDDSEEFDFESHLAENAKALLQEWAKEQEQEAEVAAALDPPGDLDGNADAPEPAPAAEAAPLAGLGAAAAGSAAGATPAPAPEQDLSFYERFIENDGKYMRVIDEHGRVLGQIQPMGGVLYGYKAVAVCKLGGCPAHPGRCARQRAWRTRSGEDPRAVDLVLAKWLHAGVHATAEVPHCKAPRD